MNDYTGKTHGGVLAFYGKYQRNENAFLLMDIIDVGI